MEYLVGNTGSKQLYFDDQLWYKLRENTDKNTSYWGCIKDKCKAHISMVDGQIKNSKLPSHAHDAVSIDEFKIQKHFSLFVRFYSFIFETTFNMFLMFIFKCCDFILLSKLS